MRREILIKKIDLNKSYVIKKKNMSDETPVPPAYCERLSKEEAQRQANEITQQRLAELNDNLEKNLTEIKNKEKLKPLDELDEQVKLSDMLINFFELDDVNQKARMLELFKEIIETRKNSQKKDKIIEEKERKIEELNEDLDESNAQLDCYQKDNIGLEKTLKRKDIEITILERKLKERKFILEGIGFIFVIALFRFYFI